MVSRVRPESFIGQFLQDNSRMKTQIHDEELDSNLNLQRGMSYCDPLEISGITYWGDFADYRTMFIDST